MAVPKLRFNEFDGGWSNKKIGEIAVVTSGGTPSRNIPKYWNGHIPWVTTSLVDFNIINNAEEFITQDGVDNSSAKLFPKNTILMAMYGQGITRGKVAILGIDATTNQACAAIKLRDGIDIHFVFQNLMNRYEEIRDLSNEGGQKNLSAGIIKDISISYPSKPEQTKIASFLSAVDEKISQLTQKHALLSQYKQGMMQKLFSQQIRFKADDGSEFGEWEETLLSEFLTESLIKGLKGNEAKKLTVKLWGKGVVSKNEAFEGSENTQYYKRFVGQLIYGKLDFLNCAFGIIPAHLDGYETTIDAPSFDINKEKANPYFLLNRFLQKDFYKKNGEEADGSRKAKRINQSVFLAMQIDLPCLEEQTKIANFLSAIDQKIEVVAQQIEQAKTWKKGLLQQMFV